MDRDRRRRRIQNGPRLTLVKPPSDSAAEVDAAPVSNSAAEAPAPSPDVAVPAPRYWQIDTIRGFGVVAMVLFHFSYDVNARVPGGLGLPPVYWAHVPDLIGFIFLTLVGISSRLAFEKEKSFAAHARRGSKILALGLVISASTLWLTPESPIYFGVLHCIGICILLLFPFLHKSRLAFQLGLPLALAGFYLQQQNFSNGWFFWLGFQGPNGRGADWYPLLPWFGVALLGVALGEKLVSRKEALAKRSAMKPSFALQALAFLGRHALVIYLAHQPILIGLVSLLF